MHYTVTDQKNFLKVEMSSNDSPGSARELVDAVLEAVFIHGRKPILVCGIGCAPLSLPDLYVLARHVKDTLLRSGKIAFIYEADSAFESSRFIENLGTDGGLNIAAFASEANAVVWLTGVTPSGGETV